MCYTGRKIEGVRESDDTNILEPNGQSRILNIYASTTSILTSCLEFTRLFTPCAKFHQIL